MTPKDASSESGVGLRQRAEAQWQAQQSAHSSSRSDREIQHLLQELQIHQIELEMQNEELRQARAALEISHNHYSDLYDFAPVGYLTLDANGRIHQANLTASTLMKIHRQDLIQRRFGVFVAESFLPAFQRFLIQAFNQQEGVHESLNCELSLITNRRDPLFVQMTAAPPSLDSKEIHIALIDISERKHAEEMLHASELNFRTLVEKAPVAIFIQTESQFVYANEACLQLFGAQSRQQLLEQNVVERFHPNYRKLVSERIRELNKGNKPVYRAEEKILRFDNTEVEVNVSAVQVLFDGKSGALVFMEDITEKKQAADRVFDLALKQEHLTMLMSFIREISHEFRTPLAIIQSDIYLLEKLADDNKRTLKVDEIKRQIAGIARLLEMMNESVLLDADISAHLESSDLNTLIVDVVDSMMKQIRSEVAPLNLALDPNLPPIQVDPIRLRRALHEIIHNSLRFTPSGGAISVRSTLHADGIMVEIQDNGPGIQPDALPYIFEWFYRQDTAHTTPGLGLGLSIAHANIKTHGGRIEVESQEGIGSLFRIILPTLNT